MGKKAARFVDAGAPRAGDITVSSMPCDEPRGSHEELEARLRFETLIADLSLKFINLPCSRGRPPRSKTPSAASASASAWTCVRFGSGRPNLRVSLR